MMMNAWYNHMNEQPHIHIIMNAWSVPCTVYTTSLICVPHACMHALMMYIECLVYECLHGYEHTPHIVGPMHHPQLP